MSYLKNLNYRGLTIFVLLLYPAFMFLPFAYSNIAIITALGLFLIGIVLKKNSFKDVSVKWIFIIAIPFFLTAISAIFSENISLGFKFITDRYSLIIFPLILLSLNPSFKELYPSLLIVVLFTVYGVTHSWFNLITHFPYDFYKLEYEMVRTNTVVQHPYIGLMSVISLVLLVKISRSKKPVLYKGFIFLLAIILISGVVLSTSRLALILLFLLGLYFTFKQIKNNFKWMLSGILILLAVTYVFTQNSIREKFASELSFKTSPRMKLWKNAYEILKNEKSVLGVGIGDYYENKIDTYWFRGEYEQQGENFKGIYGYEVHNLYLEFFLLNGVLGILFLIGIMYSIYTFWVTKSELSMLLMIILASFMFTESLLMRQWGVIFYVFTYSVAILESKKLKIN